MSFLAFIAGTAFGIFIMAAGVAWYIQQRGYQKIDEIPHKNRNPFTDK